MKLILLLSFISLNCYPQSDLVNVLKGGEILINGLSFLKNSKSGNYPAGTKVIENICVKNKLTDRISFKITGKDEDDNPIVKELVVQKEGKECLFELPKGIYSYEIVLSNKEIYKKGEYKFTEPMIITVKE